MTIVEWGRREARSKSRGHSYFITKVFGRKETKTKINLDLGVFYEPLREALCGKRFHLSVCLCLSVAWYQQHNSLYGCNQFQYKSSSVTAADPVWTSSKLSQRSSHFTKRRKAYTYFTDLLCPIP